MSTIPNTPENREMTKSIKDGTHPQFVLKENSGVHCKCGHKAVWWSTGFICGTITAYPCKYNFKKHDSEKKHS